MSTNGPERPDGGGAQSENSDLMGQPSGTQSDDEIAELSRSMLSRLSRAIETEIVPRFMLAFESQSKSRPVAAGLSLGARVEEFVQLVLEHDADVASKYVDALRHQGAPLSDVYLDLLAPSARRLGEMWETDDASFAEVAIGVCRMHQVLLEFSRCFDPEHGQRTLRADCTGARRGAYLRPVHGHRISATRRLALHHRRAANAARTIGYRPIEALRCRRSVVECRTKY